MHELPDWNRLDRAGYAVFVRRSVRRMAWTLALLGAVVTACGVGARFVPMMLVGSIVAAAGVWNLIRRKSPSALLVEGVALIVAGIFSALAWKWAPHGRPVAVGKWVLGGLAEIWWGVSRLRLFANARHAMTDPEATDRLEQIVHELTKRNAKNDPTVVEFTTGVGLRTRRSRLGLYGEGAVLVFEGSGVRLDRRGDVTIDVRDSGSFGGRLKVVLRMSDFEVEARMSPAHHERFEQWKLGMYRPGPIAA